MVIVGGGGGGGSRKSLFIRAPGVVQALFDQTSVS